MAGSGEGLQPQEEATPQVMTTSEGMGSVCESVLGPSCPSLTLVSTQSSRPQGLCTCIPTSRRALPCLRVLFPCCFAEAFLGTPRLAPPCPPSPPTAVLPNLPKPHSSSLLAVRAEVPVCAVSALSPGPRTVPGTQRRLHRCHGTRSPGEWGTAKQQLFLQSGEIHNLLVLCAVG